MTKATFKLSLYLPGETLNALNAERNLREMLERHSELSVDLQVIDIMKSPDVMEEKDLLAVPTLIRERPMPEVRLIGDFSDVTKVLSVLGLTTAE